MFLIISRIVRTIERITRKFILTFFESFLGDITSKFYYVSGSMGERPQTCNSVLIRERTGFIIDKKGSYDTSLLAVS